MHKTMVSILTLTTLIPLLASGATGISITAGDTRTSFDTAWSTFVSSSSQVRHVSPAGSDTNDGTAARPWKTIQHAVKTSQLGPGMTLYIHAGTYDGPVSLSDSASGTPSDPITIRGAPGEIRPVLRQVGEADPVLRINRSYWIIDGLEFDGRGYFEYLVHVPAGTHHVAVRNSLLRNNGKDAFVIAGSDVYAHDNVIREVWEGGSQIKTSGGTPITCTNHSECAPYGGICTNPKGTSSTRTCYEHADGHGLAIISNASKVLLRRNSVHDVSGDGLQCSGPAQGYNSGTRPFDITLEENEMFTSPTNFGATENAIDIKDCDNITVRREYYHGYRKTNGGSSHGTAIIFHFFGNGLRIEDTEVADACGGIGTGAIVPSGEDPVGNLVVARNIFRSIHRSSDGCSDRGHAIRFEAMTGADIFHNSFDDVDYSALTVGTTWHVSDVDFWNNSVALSPSGSTWISVGSTNNVSSLESDYNLFFHPDGSSSHLTCNGTRLSLASWRSSSCATTKDPNSLTGDPRYADPAAGDLSLQEGSPAIDTALDNAAPAQVCGARPDIGARERCVTPIPENPAVATLQDALDDSALDPNLWKVASQVGGTVTETTSLSLAPSASTDAASLLVESKGLYTLVDSSALVRVDEAVNAGGYVSEQFSLKRDGNNKVYWHAEGGTLSARVKVAGAATTLAAFPYSATEHRWLRLRESAGTVYWETSADGIGWTQRASQGVASLFPLDSMIVTFYVYTFGGGTPTPGQARFSRLNSVDGNTPSPGLSGIQDNFNDGTLALQWTTIQSGGTISESGGTLNFAPSANNGSVVLTVESVESRSLLGSSLFAEVPSVISTTGNMGQRLEAKLDGSNKLTWKVENGVLSASIKNAGTQATIVSLTYSPTSHRWWRIREASGTIFWDTSPDGLNWTQQATAPTSSTFPLDAVSIRLHLETWGSGVGNPGVARFDNVNVPPPMAALSP